jgi:hypothetical protein
MVAIAPIYKGKRALSVLLVLNHIIEPTMQLKSSINSVISNITTHNTMISKAFSTSIILSVWKSRIPAPKIMIEA